jgi:hypothetical protein
MKLIVNKTHSTMKNEGKILELLADMALKQDRMVEELRTVKEGVGNLETRANRIEDQITRLNLQTVENTRAIFKLAEKVDLIADINNRVTKLEKAVYRS